MPRWRVFDEAANVVASSPDPRLDVRVSHRLLYPYTGQRHEYSLIIEIENKGSSKIDDFRIDIWFPKQFLDAESYQFFEVVQEESETHKVIRRTHLDFPPYHYMPLYTGDTVRDDLIKYAVDTERFHASFRGRDLMDSPVKVVVFADGMAPMRVEKPLRSLQNF